MLTVQKTIKKRSPPITSSVSDDVGWLPVNRTAVASKMHLIRLKQLLKSDLGFVLSAGWLPVF